MHAMTSPSMAPEPRLLFLTSRLEAVSEKIRMGIPVSMTEAIEAIDYQQKLKTERDAQRSKTIIGRLMRWFRGG